jgi:hypothetical protein
VDYEGGPVIAIVAAETEQKPADAIAPLLKELN